MAGGYFNHSMMRYLRRRVSLMTDLVDSEHDSKSPNNSTSHIRTVSHPSAYVSKNDFQFETTALRSYPQKSLAERWVKQAVVLLTDPPVPSSVRALQTLMNLAHLCVQIEGLIGNFGILSVTALRMARSMNIHRLDSAPYRGQRRENGADMAELEVKRRIWWHMVASDWLLSYVPGPNEGTYMLYPGQMETSHPSNVEDGDIPAGATRITEESYSQPLNNPTSMSYSLCRIQAATLVREVIDCLPPSFFASPVTDSCDEIYDKIINLDQKYHHLLQSLPPFFQLTIPEHISRETLLADKPYLEWQRYLINFIIHTQLSRLHRPFLIRGSMQHKFAYSRMQCIKSAETVIEIRNRAMSDHSVGAFTFVLQHFLMAAIILAMDVCFNPDNVQVVPQRKQYVLNACRALETELNAKTVQLEDGVASESGNTSNGQLMVKSFQRAVQNLRGLLRKEVGDDEADSAGTAASILQETSTSRSKRPRTAAYSTAPHETLSIRQVSNVTPQRLDGAGKSSQGGYHHDRTEERQTLIDQPPYEGQAPDGLNETHGSSELIVDELWDEFFTVGSTFNDADWDMFLLNAGEQMGGIQ
ncbi:hypothetical protein BJX63DRAFT_422835 [Aspergillus granulosus]|uniref:Transcription factor domain-containing protein n=1 Tax=Aspergillus granulosus TaxID=176169 RepID=A0ABR4H5P8_9EURO